jgi:hypothetical protein
MSGRLVRCRGVFFGISAYLTAYLSPFVALLAIGLTKSQEQRGQRGAHGIVVILADAFFGFSVAVPERAV